MTRTSEKLGKKIKTAPTRVLPFNPNAFADWSAHVFTAARTQYIILTNTPSLYSMVMYGRGISSDHEFLDQGLSHLREFMVDDGHELIFKSRIAPSAGTVSFSKALNRSVIGSMNELICGAQMWLIERGLSPDDTSFKLNEMPLSVLGYTNPREALKSLKEKCDDLMPNRHRRKL